MCFLLMFLLVSLTFQATVNQDISGVLQSVAIGPGDIYNFNVVGQATSAPTGSTPTLTMTGENCTINGNRFFSFLFFFFLSFI
jgi:hypothetical protein